MQLAQLTIGVDLYKAKHLTGADPGGGGAAGLSESFGIDLYSGFRKKSRYTL